MDKNYFGGIEAGGTKFVCAIGDENGNILNQTKFPTTTPTETLEKAVGFFRDGSNETPIQAVGIGSFGPVDLNRKSSSYGCITTTPKKGWANTDFVNTIAKALQVPVGFDTDVNAAALGEHKWGAAVGLDTFVYLTIGTGIGGGGMVRGNLMAGLVHPEMGHLLLPKAPGDTFEGVCPFHGSCLEGMATGPSIEGRWGTRGADLPADHPAWDFESYYLAAAVTNYIYTLSPQRVIMGGGVMHQAFLFDRIREKVLKFLNNYVQSDAITRHIDEYIVAPGLGDRAGVLGAIALAIDVVKQPIT